MRPKISSLVEVDAKEEQYKFTGTHILGDLYGISNDKLESIDFLEKIVSDGIMKANASCHGIQVKKFNTGGITLIALLSESHVSIHTYPEYNSTFIDAFTCGEHCNPQLIIDTIVEGLKPQKVVINKVRRGKDINDSKKIPLT